MRGGVGALPGDWAAWGLLEVAGLDLGGDPAGFVGNFELPELVIGPGAQVALADLYDNGNRGGPAGVPEALYVDRLTFADVAGVLNTGGLQLYFNTLTGDPAQIISQPFALPDADGDGVPGALDICVDTSDPAQEDLDLDGIGDACNGPLDRDDDDWADSRDLCPDTADPDQADRDLDLIGDACDLCPDYPSAGADTSGNGIGDECECGDQTADGFVDVADILAINRVIFGLEPASPPLCDTNGDAECNVADILGANAKIFGAQAFCSRYPSP